MTLAHVTPCINGALPAEVLGLIFEEHAKLDWRAPVIDGQVCRLWRQTILRSPRAWAHLEIKEHTPAPSELREWLDRSGTSPLHIKVIECTPGIEKVLDQHCKRIEFLAVYDDSCSFLENRSFPTLQSLVLSNCRTPNWFTAGSMSALRSLQARYGHSVPLPSINFPPLRLLALSHLTNCERFIRNPYHSLTSLLLKGIKFQSAPGSLEFPSLHFLSLFNVDNLKPRVNVPALTAYHEAGDMDEQSFPMSLPLLTEYRVVRWYRNPPLSVTNLHEYYPNLSRLSIRAPPNIAKPFLSSLASQPAVLPMLRILVVETGMPFTKFSREDRHSMMEDVLARNMASSVKMELYFNGSSRYPSYFGVVRFATRNIGVH
jgi:hypothetical protein